MLITCLEMSERYVSIIGDILGAEMVRINSADLTEIIEPTPNQWLVPKEKPSAYRVVHESIQKRRGKVDAVITLKDFLVPLAAELQEEFGIKSPSVNGNQAWLVKDKFALRARLRDSGLNPAYAEFKVDRLPESGKFPLSCTQTWVLKPRFGFGSGGVRFLEANTRADTDLVEAVSETNALGGGARLGDPMDVLVEEYIDGPEYAVDGIIYRDELFITAVCSKTPMVRPFFEEISYQTDFPQRDEIAPLLRDATQAFFRTVQIRSAPFHLEFRVREKKAILIDASLRVGGSGLAHDLTFHSSGAHLLPAAAAVACGQDPRPMLATNRSDTAVLFLHQIGSGGIVESLPAGDAPFPHEGVHMLQYALFAHRGDRLRPYPYYSGHPGWALFTILADSCISPTELLADCLNRFRIGYRP